MILVDTSVLIDYFRSQDANLLNRLQSYNAAICGITRAEILCGARNDSHRDRLLDALDALNQVSMPQSLWDDVGETLAVLRLKGITRFHSQTP